MKFAAAAGPPHLPATAARAHRLDPSRPRSRGYLLVSRLPKLADGHPYHIATSHPYYLDVNNPKVRGSPFFFFFLFIHNISTNKKSIPSPTKDLAFERGCVWFVKDCEGGSSVGLETFSMLIQVHSKTCVRAWPFCGPPAIFHAFFAFPGFYVRNSRLEVRPHEIIGG